MNEGLRDLLALAFPAATEVPAALVPYRDGDNPPATTEALAAALRSLAEFRATAASEADGSRRNEEQTEGLAQLLASVLESSDEGIIALDPGDSIVRLNSQFVAIFRIPDEVMAFWRHDEVMAAICSRLVDPQAFRRRLAVLCADTTAGCRETLELRDGRFVEWRALPQPAVWGGVKRVISFLDVSERFRAETTRLLLERQLDETQNRLLQAEKLAAIFQLSAGLAHEISNPVGFVHSNLERLGGYVRGLIELLALYAAKTSADDEITAARQRFDIDFVIEDLPQLVDESQAGTRRLARMVTSLRVLAHAQGGEMRATTLREPLEGALARISPLAGTRIRIDANLAGALPITGRVPELIEVFADILTNAIEAIDGFGNVEVRVDGDDDTVWAEIADDGRGIAPENLSRIFDPFFTTKPPNAGMGLGLSVAYAIVSMHGGNIVASSENGQGTRFRVTLPRLSGQRGA